MLLRLGPSSAWLQIHKWWCSRRIQVRALKSWGKMRFGWAPSQPGSRCSSSCRSQGSQDLRWSCGSWKSGLRRVPAFGLHLWLSLESVPLDFGCHREGSVWLTNLGHKNLHTSCPNKWSILYYFATENRCFFKLTTRLSHSDATNSFCPSRNTPNIYSTISMKVWLTKLEVEEDICDNCTDGIRTRSPLTPHPP